MSESFHGAMNLLLLTVPTYPPKPSKQGISLLFVWEFIGIRIFFGIFFGVFEISALHKPGTQKTSNRCRADRAGFRTVWVKGSFLPLLTDLPAGEALAPGMFPDQPRLAELVHLTRPARALADDSP